MIGSRAEGTGIDVPFLTLFGLGGRIGSGLWGKGHFLPFGFDGSVLFSSGLGFSLGLGAIGGGKFLGFGFILGFGGLRALVLVSGELQSISSSLA